MKTMIRSLLKRGGTVLFTCLCMAVLSGCHGSKGLSEFEAPDEFDVSRNYEITFWAKSDTNKTQTNIYEKAIADFETIYPNIKVNLKLYTDYGHTDHAKRLYHLTRSYRHLSDRGQSGSSFGNAL